MCLILFSYAQHPSYRLALAANRDEFFDRPTAPLDFWDGEPDVLAGRDLKEGGTWFGVTRSGRFGAVTNYREPGEHRDEALSRGHLVADFLRAEEDPRTYLEELAPRADRYNGFNLLLADARTLCYFSNRAAEVQTLEPGLYGLSNHLLDTDWPKVRRGKALLEGALADDEVPLERLLDLLDDRQRPSLENLPETGVGIAQLRRQ